jgi:hypothetical protein
MLEMVHEWDEEDRRKEVHKSDEENRRKEEDRRRAQRQKHATATGGATLGDIIRQKKVRANDTKLTP